MLTSLSFLRHRNQGLLQTLSHAFLSSWDALHTDIYMTSFPGSSAGEESTCNAGNSGSIPGSGRSPGEGIGYALQYSWASLVAHMVKNPPATQETWVQSLGWEDLLEKGMTAHSSKIAQRILGQRSLAGYSPWCCKELDPMEWLSLHMTSSYFSFRYLFKYYFLSSSASICYQVVLFFKKKKSYCRCQVKLLIYFGHWKMTKSRWILKKVNAWKKRSAEWLSSY